MATATTTSKGLSMAEMKLLSDFSNVVASRQYTENNEIDELTLSYKNGKGFSIVLTEHQTGQHVDPAPEAV